MAEQVIRRPSRALLYAEGPQAMMQFMSLMATAPFLAGARRGDGHKVIVMPGFGGSDRSTAILRNYLTRQGFDAQPWGLGRNLGPRMEALPQKLSSLFESNYAAGGERKVSLVGWSLGGVYARLLAQFYPEQVRQVITLGSPFNGHPGATRSIARRVISMDHESLADLRRLAGQPLSMPNSNVYSRQDAIVPWQIATEATDQHTENIEVFTGHMSLGFSPAVLFAVADRLGQGEEAWQPFQRFGWRAGIYGRADISSAPMASSPAS
ncbi:MAG: alpha/beta fold hydrolase [Pseudomonadota bacterium]